MQAEVVLEHLRVELYRHAVEDLLQVFADDCHASLFYHLEAELLHILQKLIEKLTQELLNPSLGGPNGQLPVPPPIHNDVDYSLLSLWIIGILILANNVLVQEHGGIIGAIPFVLVQEIMMVLQSPPEVRGFGHAAREIGTDIFCEVLCEVLFDDKLALLDLIVVVLHALQLEHVLLILPELFDDIDTAVLVVVDAALYHGFGGFDQLHFG